MRGGRAPAAATTPAAGPDSMIVDRLAHGGASEGTTSPVRLHDEDGEPP